MMYAVIRIRSTINANREIRDTLKMLNLHKINSCTIIHPNPSYKGMLQKVKDYVTWGEIDAETLAELIRKRGRISGNRKLTEEYIKNVLKFDSLENFVDSLLSLKVCLKDLKGVKPVFRLHPPRKGFEAKKKPFTLGGSLGYRGEAINDLIKRMI